MIVDAPEFHHPALLYSRQDEYVAAVSGFVRAAADDGNPVLVAVPGANLRLLRGALADVGARVTFADMAVAGRNPGRIIPGVLLRFAADHPGRRVAIVGEPIWPGRSAMEYPACAAHEALINAVFAGRDASILCPYDVGRLDASVVEDAWSTHPAMVVDGVLRDSDRYLDPVLAAAGFDEPLPRPPRDAASLVYRDSLAAVRCFVRRHTAGWLPEVRTEELVLAASEVAANTVEHTSGPGSVACWVEPGLVVCQLHDTGQLTDPLAGRLIPPDIRHRGYGLVLANELCDLVRIHVRPCGTTVRLHQAR
ncbi:anti-sigma regulatory factor (Ser/Thr protein kinase) [Actinoplanes octamycinicus]|uniref:Anti-sigma regulatory factor (Ser/Thr protein kinase) n=1 Tax=Actinoplanes octamycinicus TaxID=135948 RepID=A0A7W7H289_9ACTN|nr:sensor histidine kinase [Actinoplanes octamycinicus]MBB4742557.1 anti-sigma regulatory factor (Ser/Thr protein kinase) [Actinoplanes octamycinicus]GIE60895.1 anti-sigma regulatory factor [Actinoplanes octamycinicus]